MKKLFIFGAISVLALASCSKDVTVSENRDADVIGYSVATGAATKAANVYCNNAKPTSFYVWATLPGSANAIYINGDAVNYLNGAWTPSTNRYWPVEAVNFFATVGVTPTVGEKATFDYTVKGNVAEQEDILYAANLGATKDGGAVEMNFRHALSQVVFKAKNKNNALYVVVDGIKFGNLYDEGSFEFGAESTTTNFEDHDATPPTVTKNGVVNVTTKSTDTPDSYYSVSFTEVPVPGSETNPVVKDLTYVADGANEKAMILLPQENGKWVRTTNETGSYIAVKCAIYNVADPTNGYASATDVLLYGTEANGTVETKWATIPLAVDWKPGMKYVYTLVFDDFTSGGSGENPGGDEVLSYISYEVTVDDFEVVNQPEVDMEF